MSPEVGTEPPRAREKFRTTIARTVRIGWSAEPRTLVLMMALSVLPALLPPVTVLLSKRLVDLIALATTQPVPGSALFPIVGGLTALTAVQSITRSLIGVRQELFTERVTMETTRRFLRHAATVDLGHFDNSTWYDRVARAQRDIGWRPGQMTWSVIGMAGNLVTLIGMLGILASLHPFLVALVVGSVLPTIAVSQYLNRRIYSFYWTETPEGREREYLSTLLSEPRTAKEIRSFGLAEHLVSRQRTLWDDYYRRMKRMHMTQERYLVATATVSALTFGAAYWFVGDRGLAGQLTAGALTAVIAAFASITQQFNLITQSLVIIGQHATFLDDYFSFLAIEPLLDVPATPTLLPARLEAGIHFEDVHFTYPGGSSEALAGVDLVVHPGELVALVGENGAGKSSLVKLLLRFYDPTAGRVTIGGVDLRDVEPADIRSRVGILFQDFAQFELTARDNVSFGESGRTHTTEGLWEALRAARADGIVAGLRDGLETNVGRLFEGGHDLSGGEWQRLALARLMYRDADIWILDEPTSALDPEAEAGIFAELRENLSGRMGLVISHRFSTVRIADKIAVFEDGRVSEFGTHEDLIALDGRYAHLFELQAAGYR